MTLKFNSVLAVVKIHVHGKYHQAECIGSSVIAYTNLFALSRSVSENPVVTCAPISLHGWGDTQWPITPTTVLLSFTFIPPGTV